MFKGQKMSTPDKQSSLTRTRGLTNIKSLQIFHAPQFVDVIVNNKTIEAIVTQIDFHDGWKIHEVFIRNLSFELIVVYKNIVVSRHKACQRCCTRRQVITY